MYSKDPTRAAFRSVAVALAAIAAAGCGQERVAVRTVTVHETAGAASSQSPSRAHRQRHKARAASKPRSPAFTQCDANISVKAATTTCGFAQNTFFEYWTGGEASDIQVYSPAVKRAFATHCAVSNGTVSCTTNDHGAVRFSVAAVDRYDQDQADAYASSHDLGSGSPSGDASPAYTPPADDTSTPSYDGGADFCDTHDCIPNYDNGNGYTVQCSDGTYSQSGGIQGACSHHGGVG
jgi:hypothetical protein